MRRGAVLAASPARVPGAAHLRLTFESSSAACCWAAATATARRADLARAGAGAASLACATVSCMVPDLG